jgi:low temperature requirement protein LtrA
MLIKSEFKTVIAIHCFMLSVLMFWSYVNQGKENATKFCSLTMKELN